MTKKSGWGANKIIRATTTPLDDYLICVHSQNILQKVFNFLKKNSHYITSVDLC